MAFEFHTLSHYRLHIQPYNNGRKTPLNGDKMRWKLQDSHSQYQCGRDRGISFPQAMDKLDGLARHSLPSTCPSPILGIAAGKGAVLELQLVGIQEPRQTPGHSAFMTKSSRLII